MRARIASRLLLPLAIAALPVVLLLSSLRTLREADEQRTIYLRHRVAMLAARLENLPDSEVLSEQEPYLLDLQVLTRGSAANRPGLAPLWDGRELFRTEFVQGSTATVFRAYVPFHSHEELRIACIDLDPAAADFLVTHARHNVAAASLGGLVLVLLSVYALWAMRHAARLREREIEIEHLAHIGKMSAALAHEIRNPLGTIKGFIQLAGERGGEPAVQLLAPALAETRRLETLVSDLLSYGRPPLPRWQPTTWDDVARAIVEQARQMIGSRPIRLVVEETDWTGRSDPALLHQTLLNLVRNALEAIPEDADGEIRLSAHALENGGLEILVADTGVGISDEALAHLCEPFFTTRARGTGLGLAITSSILKALGGDVKLCRRKNGGTEAVVRLTG